jgi:NADH-quinone oxidoreductase subunit L
MGGLRHKMPTTFWTFLIGSAALAGIPFTSGFFSKDAILAADLAYSFWLYFVGLLTALLTAIYAFRAVFVAFLGKPRNKHLYDHAHESPALMTVPLWILAVLSLVAGLMNLPFVLSLEEFLEPALGSHEAPGLVIELAALMLSTVMALFGLLVAYARYVRGDAWATRLAGAFTWILPALNRKWWFDDVYNAYIVRPLWAISDWLRAVIDERVVDGAVNGVGNVSMRLGEWARRLQNGYVPTYALSILIGVAAMVVYFLIG